MVSPVAAILDRKGGLRVVVANDFAPHIGKGEQLFVVPDYFVNEPVPWDEIPEVIEKAQKHVAKTLAPTNHCGECMACCRTLYIKEGPFKKHSNSWCGHCAVGFGCKLYQSRPNVCRQFECEWLKSQQRNDKMHAGLRPDRCGAIFTSDTTTNDPLIIECHGTPDKHAWAWINEMQAVGYKVKNITFYVGEEDA